MAAPLKTTLDTKIETLPAPNQQFGAKLRIAEMEGRIRCTTLFVPCKPLVVHPARATGEAGHFPVLSSVGFQFERKALANNHAYMILAFIEKHAAYISALKDGALRRNWVKVFVSTPVAFRVSRRNSTGKCAAVLIPIGS